jgi:hypothetical protein
MKYFRVLADDARSAGRWFLGEPLADTTEEIDAREFTYGRPYLGPVPTQLPVDNEGDHMQFNLAAFDMPVTSYDVTKVVNGLAGGEVEVFPIMVDRGISGYSILNVVCREACVDERRSRVVFWTAADARPDLAGTYRMVYDLTVDPTRARGRHIFRIKDFEVALIVSQSLKEALEKLHNLGVVFQAVC